MLTKSFMMISIEKNPLFSLVYITKYFSALRVNPLTAGAAYIRVFISILSTTF